ncbi:MAG TPA: radical SAM protein [Planctomycetota bacterium]|nr:radical SAM protein [Planctomycetota bacterium]
MRTLLINSNRFHQPWPVIPFGLCCVASALEQAGHEVRVLDLCFSRDPARSIAAAVADLRPDAVGVGIRNIDNCAGHSTRFLLDAVREEAIEPLKRVFPGPIVIGGPAVGISGAEMLRFFDLEYAIRGDGEAAMVEFLRRLSAGEPLDGMGGLVRLLDGRITENNDPMCVERLDELPAARAWRWLDLKPYVRAGSPLQIQTKRGCALGCTYCTYNRIEGRAWRLRSPQRVAAEIEELVRESGIRRLEFTDSTFNIPLEHCKAVLREIAGRGLDLQLHTMGLNPGAVDEELADLLQAAGFRDVDLGAESGCDATLRSLGKNFRKDALLRAGRLLHERSIAVHWFLLVGAPDETPATLAETFATIGRAAAPWDLVDIGVGLRVYSGSPVAERLRAEGAAETGDNFLHPVAFQPRGISLDAVKALTKREALRHANFLMYDEDENTPMGLLVLANSVLRRWAPGQPLWRLFILIRRLQMLTGFNLLRRAAFALSSRRVRGLAGLEPAGCTMRTRRPLSLNNSLVHGICNCNCQTCGVNKAGYKGPREYQPREVTGRLIARVEQAAAAGVRVRYIANSGDGEPTLHPEFRERMDMFGAMLRNWAAPVPAPEVSVVTNGQRLLVPGVLEAVAGNRLTLIVSFPTTEPADYGRLMFGRPERGAETLETAKAGIRRAMELRAEGRIPRLCFHLSPPEREMVRRGFPETVGFLTREAERAGLGEVELVLFPATSNRSGLVRSRGSSVDFYPDLVRAFNGRAVNGVRVNMSISYRRFFPKVWEVLDLVRSFSLPCMWNAHLFITAAGDSICCNDQAVRAPRGNVLTDSIASLMARKEAHLPGAVCAGCDQRPDRMKGGLAVTVFSLLARARLALARLAAHGRRAESVREQAPAGESRPAAAEAAKGYAFARRMPPEAPAPAGMEQAGFPDSRERVMRSRLTEALRNLEEQDGHTSAGYRFGADGAYSIRVAASAEDRRKAWRLAYRVYRGKDYAGPNAQELWYGLHDALPGTTTLLVERQEPAGSSRTQSVPVAALTLVFDSPLGLPADELYRSELDGLRAGGRKLCEIVSLVSIETDLRRGAEIMKHLFKLAYLVAHHLEGATDFLITVNPRHVSFYKRMLLMTEAGPERAYAKVGGAPAVLLGLDLVAAWETYREHFGHLDGDRNLYRFFLDRAGELREWLRGARRPLDEASLRRYFVEERPLLAGAVVRS